MPTQEVVVFAPDFLEFLSNREPQPFTTQEAFWTGPWTVAENGEEFIVHRVSDPTPVAFTQYRETARLVAATLPAVARGPLYWLSAERNEEHGLFDLLTIIGEKGLDSVGRFERRHEEILGPLSTIEFLLRCPASMAHLIEAASRDVLEQAGHMIAERLKRTAHKGDDVERIAALRDALRAEPEKGVEPRSGQDLDHKLKRLEERLDDLLENRDKMRTTTTGPIRSPSGEILKDQPTSP